jgi:hypothetical protein
VALGRPVGLLAGVLIGRSGNINFALRATPELSYRPYVTEKRTPRKNGGPQDKMNMSTEILVKFYPINM